jgi:hypothetical protein
MPTQHVVMLSVMPVRKQAPIASCCPGDSDTWWTVDIRYTDEGQPIRAIVTST